ncbi:MAG: hypothetical protein OHK93_005157 [Ramalina farinacea]|uniref:Uncharacterized protein n=1 Tax=Ramalina farinacea TaxID=258253 RepID=A0AA43QXG3_9LECA|nr:hypothetical protein [Ramalina farinacea]
MSPLLALRARDSPTSASLRSQWSNPRDILSLLLIVGGDVVHAALAQQSGDVLPTPVVFSFGWVAYAFSAVLSVMGKDRFMPINPDVSIEVASTGMGYARTNKSWILGRLLRDFETYWIPAEAKHGLEAMLKSVGCPKAGICISVFEASSAAEAGVPKRDLYWYSGYAAAVFQLCIAIIPWAIRGDWMIFVITAAGTILAFTTASLPQWRAERWQCRRYTSKDFILSRGNGSQHALIILGQGRGLDLEDLAGSGEAAETMKGMAAVTTLLTALWIALLVTVSGIQEHTWFLVAVGALGMFHTIVVAGAPRRPEWFGIHLVYRDFFVEKKVIEALKAVESKYANVGKAMVPTFFPNGVRVEHEDWASIGQTAFLWGQ